MPTRRLLSLVRGVSFAMPSREPSASAGGSAASEARVITSMRGLTEFATGRER